MPPPLPANWRNLDVIVGIANPPAAKSGTFMKESDFQRFIDKVNKTNSFDNAIPVHINHVVKDSEGKPSTPVGHVFAAGIHPTKKNLVVALVIHDTPEGKLASRLIKNGEMSLDELSLGLNHYEVAKYHNKEFGPMGYVPVQSDATEISLCTKGAHEGTKFVYQTTLGDYIDGNVKTPSDKGMPSYNNINKSSTETITTLPTETRIAETVASASPFSPYAEMIGISNYDSVKINPAFATSRYTPIVPTNMNALLALDRTPARDRIFEVFDRLNAGTNYSSAGGARYSSTTASAAPAPVEPQVSEQSKSSEPQQTDSMDDMIKQIKDQYEKIALIETNIANQQQQQQQQQPPVQAAPTETPVAPVENISEMDLVLPSYNPLTRPAEMNLDEFVRNELNMDPASLAPGVRASLETMLRQSNMARQLPYELEVKRLEKERLDFQELLRKNLPSILETMRKKNMNVSLDSVKNLFAAVPLIQDGEAKKTFANIVSTFASAVADNKQLQQQQASMNAIQREKEYSQVESALRTAEQSQKLLKDSLKVIDELTQSNKRLKTSFQEFKEKYPFGYSRDDRVVSTSASASSQQQGFTFNATKNSTSTADARKSEPTNILGAVAYLEATKLFPEAMTEFPDFYDQTRQIWSDMQQYRVARTPTHSDFTPYAKHLKQKMIDHPILTGAQATYNPYNPYPQRY